MEQPKYKKRWGDKRDGRLIRGDELDTNHFVMPLCWPRRTDNEAYITDILDLTNAEAYIKEFNATSKIKLTIFMLYLSAISKAFILRPKMNRFYRNHRLYERYKTSIGFIVKKSLNDDAQEALARVYVEPTDTIYSLIEKIQKEIDKSRLPELDKSSDELRTLMKFPHWIGGSVMGIMKMIDRHTAVPESISASDLFFCSIVISNLGSIGLQAGYHHLSNWGTNSFFTTLGKRKVRPFNDNEGNVEYKTSIDFGMTIDERIVDGYYYSKTINMMRQYIENPKLLEKPFNEE